jgi:hypothetical protein
MRNGADERIAHRWNCDPFPSLRAHPHKRACTADGMCHVKPLARKMASASLEASKSTATPTRWSGGLQVSVSAGPAERTGSLTSAWRGSISSAQQPSAGHAGMLRQRLFLTHPSLLTTPWPRHSRERIMFFRGPYCTRSRPVRAEGIVRPAWEVLRPAMSDAFERPDAPRSHRDSEYQDFHFHDEDDVAPVEDWERRRMQPPPRRKPNLPPQRRRRYEED